MRVIAGPEKKTRVFSELERKITAYHEMRHALVGHFLRAHRPRAQDLDRQPRPGARTDRVAATDDRFLMSVSALLDQLAMMLGGRAAEELVFNEITTGAANDLERATGMSRQMITRFGMSRSSGPDFSARDPRQPFLGRELGNGALLLGGDGAGDRRRDLPPDRRGAPACRPGAPRAPAGSPRHRRDPDRARDDDREQSQAGFCEGEPECDVLPPERATWKRTAQSRNASARARHDRAVHRRQSHCPTRPSRAPFSVTISRRAARRVWRNSG